LVASLLAIGVAVVGLPLAMYLLQERLIFFPQPMQQAQRELIERRSAAKSIFLESPEGVRLHAWYFAGSPLILYFGGNAEDVSGMIDDAERRAPGVGWLLVDYRGYGSSEGEPSEAALTADAAAWHDHALKTLKARKIYLFGRSLGSGVAVHLASERPVAGVVLVAPFDSMIEVAKRHYPYLPVKWMLRHRFDSAKLAPHIGAPLLCIAASRDEVIPALHARKLYDAWGGPKRWVEIEGAGHNSTDGAPVFWQSIKAFLQEY